MTTTDFNPMAVAKTHNQSPELLLFQEIDDLYEEARNFADGEPIASQEMADAITTLREGIHEAGKKADALRVEEKKPHDDAAKAVQDKYNPYVQPKKGRVDMAKSALDSLLTPWRQKVAAEKAAEAARIAREAEAAKLAAQAAMQASAGNLAEREAAEELLADAKALEKTARRADKAATTGLGLRTVWEAELVDVEKALDWAYGRDAAAFHAVAQRNADELVRSGVRSVPGFRVVEEKVASAGRAA
ncbi:hypothetical protein [Shinella zoogloeoides]|uniref:hypothetical protein n=1 Tax=Shinella zoogloeoides TaxID=352475 RepID=UPI001F587F56|nr:hypothetical protein [Shinella zoogloeoides]